MTQRQRDLWPLTRLAVVVMGAPAAFRMMPGWGEAFGQLPGLAAGMLETALALLCVSPAAAQLYLAAMMAPLVLIVLLNDWIYNAAAGLLRLLTGGAGGVDLRWAALALELCAFIALGEIVRSTIATR